MMKQSLVTSDATFVFAEMKLLRLKSFVKEYAMQPNFFKQPKLYCTNAATTMRSLFVDDRK